MHMNNIILSNKSKIPPTEKLPESIESSKFVSYRRRMSGEFDSRRDSHLAKFKRRPRIFIKLCFTELCDSKLSGLHPFDNVAIVHLVKNRLKTEMTVSL